MSTHGNMRSKGKLHLTCPHVYVLLLGIIIICALLSYIVPAGEYNRVKNQAGRTVVEAESYHRVESVPLGVMQTMLAVPKGMIEAAEIIFFIFIIGGAFQVMNATNAIMAGIGRLTQVFGGREKILFTTVIFAFGTGAAVFGMAEETLPFIPIMITLCLALGYDSLTGAAIVLCSASAGLAGAFLNPFTLGVAQGIAELPLFSGLGFRLVVFFSMLSLATFFIVRYAGRVKLAPESSAVFEIDRNREGKVDLSAIPEFTGTHKLILLILVAIIAVLIYGVTQLGWYILEMSALFLMMSILIAIVGRLGANRYGEELANGMAGIAGGALVVGFARGILVVLQEGMIMDTMLASVAGMVAGLPAYMSALGMYVFQCLLNFIVPSGGGQAAVSMPIMTPLSDLVGVTRQTAVLAYQLGDAISNIFTPTSGYFMAGLALAKIPWDKWARWFLPLMMLEYALGAIFVVVAQLMRLGPL